MAGSSTWIIPCTSRERHQWINPCYFIIVSFVWRASCITSHVSSFNGCPVLKLGQIPVMACDQPLFDITKQIQWISPNSCGEDLYVIMLGGFHIEMAACKAFGKWLDSSGWKAAVVQDATPGKADSFLKALHVFRASHAHQVTASALYTLLQKAYSSYGEEHNDLAGNFDELRQLKEDGNPQLKFWSLTLEIQLSVLVFVRSLREGYFHLYIQVLQKISSLMFALDHPNYAR